MWGFSLRPEPVFVNLLFSPGIDSQPGAGGPVRQPYLSYRPAKLHRLAESIPVLHEHLQIRAQFQGPLDILRKFVTHTETSWIPFLMLGLS